MRSPRLLSAEAIKDTISRGVGNGMLAYVGKTGDGGYNPFHFNTGLMAGDVEVSEDMFIIPKEAAEACLKAKTAPIQPPPPTPQPSVQPPPEKPEPQPPKPEPTTVAGITWTGDVPHQKWMNFYSKVLAKFATAPGLRVKVTFEARPAGGISQQRMDETKSALRELGLHDTINFE